MCSEYASCIIRKDLIYSRWYSCHSTQLDQFSNFHFLLCALLNLVKLSKTSKMLKTHVLIICLTADYYLNLQVKRKCIKELTFQDYV